MPCICPLTEKWPQGGPRHDPLAGLGGSLSQPKLRCRGWWGTAPQPTPDGESLFVPAGQKRPSAAWRHQAAWLGRAPFVSRWHQQEKVAPRGPSGTRQTALTQVEPKGSEVKLASDPRPTEAGRDLPGEPERGDRLQNSRAGVGPRVSLQSGPNVQIRLKTSRLTENQENHHYAGKRTNWCPLRRASGAGTVWRGP